MKKLYVFCLLTVWINHSVPAQQINYQNTDWMTYLEDLAEEEDADQNSIELLHEELSLLSETPLNINVAEKNDLERLPFLNIKQIEDILYYIYKYGPVMELLELKNIESLNRQTINYILPFLYAGEKEKKDSFNWGNLFRYGKQEILVRSDQTVQEKSGYRESKDGKTSNQYLGEPYYFSFRYAYKYQEKIQFGIAGEKDAGERLWNKETKGLDHYAFNLNIKENGILKDLHLGDYRLAFGEGLTVNTQFSVGKTTDIGNPGLKNTGIKRHASPNENNYFKGAAASIRIQSVYLNLFGSSRYHDANADSLCIYSFKTNGYNRTEKELEKKKNALIHSAGGNIQWRNENITLGLSSIVYSFGGKELSPENQPYNLYYLRGKSHANLGFHYLYQDRYLIFRGETAIDKNNNWASLNHLILQPNNQINFNFSVRNYQKGYNAFFGKAFGETSFVRDESGAYAGIHLKPSSQWEVTSYIDFFRFSWFRYGVNSLSSGKDFLSGVVFYPNSSTSLSLRYKYKEKAKNQISEDGRSTHILPYRQHRFRQQIHISGNENFNTKFQADYTIYKETNQTHSGYSLSQNFSIIPDKKRPQWDIGIAYFHTEDWDSRISVYEKNILYAFSLSSYYGEGLRTYSVLKWKVYPPMTIYLKVSNTHYFDRILIGSGTDEIEGNNKTDISALIKVSF